MRDTMKAFLRTFLFGLLLVAAGLAQAACFSVDDSHEALTRARGVLVYETKNKSAVAAALALSDTKKADMVRVYASPDKQQAAVVFFINGCVATQAGTEARNMDEATLYVMLSEQALQLVKAMLAAEHRSRI